MKKLLIVEDEPDMARMEQMMLESSGYSISIAGTVSEALKILKKDKIDLILLDVILPGDHGDELLKKLQDDSTLKKIPG